MINGVLVERTVQDVVPALKTNAEGLKQVLEELVKQYKTKQDDLEKWKVCYYPRSYPHANRRAEWRATTSPWPRDYWGDPGC